MLDIKWIREAENNFENALAIIPNIISLDVPDGSVIVPKVLVPYMGGLEVIAVV